MLNFTEHLEAIGSMSFKQQHQLVSHILSHIRKRRLLLLLIASLLVLLIPGFLTGIPFAELLFFLCLSFLFVQSMIVATQAGAKNKLFRYFVVAILIIATWLEPAGKSTHLIMMFRLVAIISFFCFVVFSLAKYLTNAKDVHANVLLAAVNIYLLMGIVGGYLAQLLYVLDSNAFIFPSYVSSPEFTDFFYYSFISMTTVGYGDIVPGTRQGQTLSYLLAISGQLYVAIIIAIIVGKYAGRSKPEEMDSEKYQNDNMKN